MITDAYESDFSHGVQKSMLFLFTQGYIFLGVTHKHTDAIGPYLIGTYENVTANRLLEISYFPKNIAPREAAVTRVLQIEADKLDDFDISTTQSMKIEGRKIFEFNGEYSERLSAYLDEIATTLENEYLDVLVGKKWLSDQFDWQGLK